jgi:hypothetical protein
MLVRKFAHKNLSGALHCTENPNYLLPEKKQRDLSPNFHIHVSVSDLYIPTIGPPIFLQQNRQIDRAQKHECRNWDRGSAVSFLGIFVSNFRYSFFAV